MHNKFLKHISLTIILCIMIQLIFIMPVLSVDISSDQIEFVYSAKLELNLLTGEVPDSAAKFAQEYFMSIDAIQLADMGFTQNEIEALRLAPGIKAYEYDKCDNSYYYFPLITESEIIAVMTVIELENDVYTAQFGKTNFALNLNKLVTSKNSPSALVITKDAFYALNSSNEFVILEDFLYEYKDERVSKNSNNTTPSLLFTDIGFENKLDISIETAFTESINRYTLFRIPTIYLGSCAVPFVANGSHPNYPNGYCGAASAASVIKFRISTTQTATQIKDSILSGYPNSQHLPQEIKTIMQSYIPSTTITLVHSPLSLWQIRDCLGNQSSATAKPIYSHWESNSYSFVISHAMVVRGYRFDDQYVGPGAASITVMDPNFSSYQSVMADLNTTPNVWSYNTGIYTINWLASVY